MPIANVSTLYQRIHHGSEGGNEFARFMRLLLMAEHKLLNQNFIAESDASGDFKRVDAYIPGDEEFKDCIIGFQFKFFPYSLSASQKTAIVKSIENALKENEYIQELIIVTPDDWQKEQLDWFDALKKKFEKSYWAESSGYTRKCRFQLVHWGHSKIIELALRHGEIGKHYFPELYSATGGQFKLSKAVLDTEACSWFAHEGERYSYHSGGFGNKHIKQPLFDFQFKNSTQQIYLLQSIEVHIEEVWTTLKGIPVEMFLKSIGVIEIPIDFKNPVNVHALKDPLIVNPGTPVRFHVQLSDFTKCPGNCVRLKFWFHFDETSVSTPVFYLGL